MFYRYIYKITYLPTKQFYIGKRKAKENCKPEEDFAIYYFTSASSNSWIKKSLKKNRELWNIEFLACNAKTDEELAKHNLPPVEVDRMIDCPEEEETPQKEGEE